MGGDSDVGRKIFTITLSADEAAWLERVGGELARARYSGAPATAEQRDAAFKFLAVMLRKSGGGHG